MSVFGFNTFVYALRPREHIAWLNSLDNLMNTKNEPWRRENHRPRKKKKKHLALSH